MSNVKQNPILESINTGSAYKCWPAIRNEYRKHAYDAYCDGEMDRAILYDSRSLSCSFVGTQLNDGTRTKTVIDEHDINHTIHLQQNTVNPLIDYLSECLSDMEISSTKTTCTEENVAIDEQLEINGLYEKCAKLPTEWNVIQISQMYHGYDRYATKKDLYNGDGPIVLTLFRYNLAEKRENRAIYLVIDTCEINSKNLFSTTYELNQVLYKLYSQRMNTPEFNGFIKILTQTQTKLLADMKNWLGPWITLFSGKIKGADGDTYEQTLFDEVKQLCQNFDDEFPDDDLVLLSLIARRIDLLDAVNIKRAARYFARNSKEFNRIIEWMGQLKKKRSTITGKEFQYYPCILVLDELVDQMPWEMLIPSQEFSRMHSIYMLIDLYERFKDQIHDGYYQVNIKDGFALINPDNDDKLHDMFQRLSQFYDKYLSNWKRIELTVPKNEEIIHGLSESDVFVYSGHGTSLQCFNTDAEYNDVKHQCLVLLFGCESLAMRPRGTICEATSPSYIFYKNGSPGMLGALTIVTDIWVDLLTMLIITQWITSPDIEHPVIDICKDADSKRRVNQILAKRNGHRNSNLLAILCDIRNETAISMRMRSAMVYRGLPPCNVAMDEHL